jgi:hypothetical protein
MGRGRSERTRIRRGLVGKAERCELVYRGVRRRWRVEGVARGVCGWVRGWMGGCLPGWVLDDTLALTRLLLAQ